MMKNIWGGYSPAPRKDPYNKQDTRVEYQIFSNEYFSGADMHIYFGDIWVDEITDISFTLQEEVLPIFGYNSYTYDTIARGKRMIQGQFTLNFTSTGYLQQVLTHADAIEHALEVGKQKKIVDPKYYEQYKLDEILKLYGKESFEQIANEYEEALWGVEEDNENTYLSPVNAPYFQRNTPMGFDIRIQYGAVSEMMHHKKKEFYESNKGNAFPNLTVETINGVQINGFMKTGSTSSQGAPVQETYSFIARDLNGTSLT
jgi:hypothetical protein